MIRKTILGGFALVLLIPVVPLLAGEPTWKYADYRDRDETYGTCGTMRGCLRKVWRECACARCQSHPTDDAGKAGCDCHDSPDEPTQVQVYQGRCLSQSQTCPGSPCPKVYYCVWPSVPAGTVEAKPQCQLGQGS